MGRSQRWLHSLSSSIVQEGHRWPHRSTGRYEKPSSQGGLFQGRSCRPGAIWRPSSVSHAAPCVSAYERLINEQLAIGKGAAGTRVAESPARCAKDALVARSAASARTILLWFWSRAPGIPDGRALSGRVPVQAVVTHPDVMRPGALRWRPLRIRIRAVSRICGAKLRPTWASPAAFGAIPRRCW